MARLTVALLLVSAAFAQAAVLPIAWPLEVAPNVVVALLFLWSLRRGVREAVAWAFGMGVLLDLLALDPLGANGLALLPAVLLGPPARRRFFQSGLVVPIVLAGCATAASGVVLVVLRGAVGDEPVALTTALRVIVPRAIMGALLVPLLYPLTGWLDRRLLEARG
jgi:rod shape-determining protein MreD